MGVERFEGSIKALNGPHAPQVSEQASYYDEQLSKYTGLTRYSLITDSDRMSTTSSDDTVSVVESIFDVQSVVSSQSSEGSNGSNSDPEDSSDGESTAREPNQSTAAVRSSRTKFDQQQEELLSGLHSETLPYRTLSKSNHNTNEVNSNQSVHTSQDVRNVRRRSVAHETSVIPRLKRDTDNSDCFVMLLISFATKLITAIWPLSACPPMMSSSFNGAGVLPLQVFIHETLRRSKTSYSTLQVALWYLVVLKCQLPNTSANKEQRSSDCRAMQCGRRMFLAALMLASKYLQDRNYSTRAWSKISGLRMCEINENEMKYLQAIDYSLHMKKDIFENWSRLVIQLSKLSKLRPGCVGFSQQSKDASDGSDPMSLHSMLDDEAPANPTSFSDVWWAELLAKLNTGVCQNAQSTEDFLRETVPQALLSDRSVDLSSTPKSQDYAVDSAFSDRSSNASDSGASTPVQHTQSPSSAATTLPLRPQPRNLPTPMSTPRASDGWSWSQSSQPSLQNLRCSASVDALRNMRKQCFANANLDRCPPPRPQSYHTTSRSQTRPAVSSQFNGCQLPSPSNSSQSDTSGRSRSSSTSSNLSWSCVTASDNDSTAMERMTQYQCQEPSPLTRVVSMPESRLPPANARCEQSLRRMDYLADFGTARSAAAGTKSGLSFGQDVQPSVDITKAVTRNPSSDDEIAQALLSIAYGSRSTTPPSHENGYRGHKRTCSSTSDRNQISSSHPNDDAEDEVMSDVNCKTSLSFADFEKGLQIPTKAWAMPKKPMSRPFDHKRMALCYPSRAQDRVQETAAAKHAALLLRDQMISA